jgi:histidinol dehydrogenase
MLITPAVVAGAARICAASPVVRGTSSIHYKTLVAMDLAGADEIYAIGGSQAVAAFTYGTEQINPVDIIVGPGNRYVSEAKRQCYGKVGIDFVAGPSEVLIIADAEADPSVLVADHLAQCEHDVNAKGILITTDRALADKVAEAVESELSTLSTAEVAGRSWNDYGEIILVDDLAEAVSISNSIAPEHLELNVKDPSVIIEDLVNYGSMFIGGGTAEVFGDYASGTNHTLPTMGASRYTGGLWVGTFLKVCTAQWMSNEGSKNIAPLVRRLAEGEGLMGHAEAAGKRI